MDVKTALKQRMIPLCEEKGINVAQLAHAIGVHPMSLEMLFNPNKPCTLHLGTLYRMADVLDTSIDYLVGRTDKKR